VPFPELRSSKLSHERTVVDWWIAYEYELSWQRPVQIGSFKAPTVAEHFHREGEAFPRSPGGLYKEGHCIHVERYLGDHQVAFYVDAQTTPEEISHILGIMAQNPRGKMTR
jgi:hypothetical protein